MKVPLRTRAVLTLALSLVAFVNLVQGQETEAAPTTEPAAPNALEPTPTEEVAAPAIPEPAPSSVTESAVTITEEPALTKSAEAESDGRLSVDFPDEDIRNILRNVADLFELNLIIPESLQGKTTIKLRNVTWRQIFEKVLTPIGYGFIRSICTVLQEF